ncbi:hypothetical protein BJ912DRAFT_948396 [Pholiota molesta]|nr:hypothetical protein BJ912DRAFT_948396 [Pholiota molesta]
MICALCDEQWHLTRIFPSEPGQKWRTIKVRTSVHYIMRQSPETTARVHTCGTGGSRETERAYCDHLLRYRIVSHDLLSLLGSLIYLEIFIQLRSSPYHLSSLYPSATIFIFLSLFFLFFSDYC